MADNSLIKKVIISKIITETKDAKTFVLQPLNGWVPAYESGQFITLVFYTKHGEKRRSYSFSSALNEQLSITIKKVDNGEFSRLLLSHAKEGDVLFTSGISGFFKLPQNFNYQQQVFFVAAGSGITPCISLIKNILAKHTNDVVLVYSNKSKADAIFYDSLLQLQQQYESRFIIRFLFSDNFNVYQSRLSDWLLQLLLKQYLKVDKSNALFFLCGPFDYMLMATISLLSNEVPAQNIIKENFNTLPRINTPKPPDSNAHKVFINIHNNKYNVEVQYPQTILAAAKANHIQLPYSCEVGRCGSCAATCTKGKAWMAYNEVLMDDEIKKGRILTCQSFPIDGDIEISFKDS